MLQAVKHSPAAIMNKKIKIVFEDMGRSREIRVLTEPSGEGVVVDATKDMDNPLHLIRRKSPSSMTAQ